MSTIRGMRMGRKSRITITVSPEVVEYAEHLVASGTSPISSIQERKTSSSGAVQLKPPSGPAM